MKKIIILIALSLANTLCFADDASTKQESIIVGVPELPVYDVLARELLFPLLEKANIKPIHRVVPSPSMAQLIMAGDIDAELGRVYSYGLKYPEIYRVKHPYYYVNVVGFGLKSRKFNIKGTADLENLRVGVILGAQASMDIAAGLKKVVLVDSDRELYSLLVSKKIDIAIDAEINGIYLGEVLGYEIEKKAMFIRNSIFLYMNRDKENIGKLIDDKIVELTASGELQKMQEDSEAAVVREAKMKRLNRQRIK